MLKPQALMALAAILGVSTLITNDRLTSILFGIAFIVVGFQLYKQKRVSFRDDFMSLNGIATLMLFFSLLLFGIMYLLGPFVIPVVGMEVSKTLAQYATAIIILLSYLKANFKRR